MNAIKFILSLSFSLIVGLSMGQNIDSEQSLASFAIGNMKVNTVRGTLTGMQGTISFAAEHPESSHFDVCINAGTVNTGNKKRDEHLCKDDFFDVEQFPDICITSKSVSKKGSEFLLKGTLSLLGISKEIEIPFTYENNTFQGTFIINRFDYNLGENTGKFMVSEDVEINILCKLKE